ncbi:MAG: hypothetical protein Q8R36_00580 [bacterium]|nr:hypothetical protein [bacterium]
MNPVTSRTTIVVGLAVLAALVLFFVVSIKRGSLPDDGFTAPVYVQDESPTAITRPLYLEVSGGGLSALTQEQKQHIADFKKKILARIASRNPLTGQEKTVLAISTATTSKPVIGDFLVADQSVFQFSVEELKAITRTLQN